MSTSVTRNVQLYDVDAEWLRSQRKWRDGKRETAKDVFARIKCEYLKMTGEAGRA